VRKNPYLVIILGFAFIIIAGAVLLFLPWATRDGQGLMPLDALFMAASGTCVTGLTVIDVGKDLTVFGRVILLVMIQIGGLGLMTVSTFFGLLLGLNSRLADRMVLRESLNQVEEFHTPHLISRIIIFTLGIEAAGALLLMLSLNTGDNGGLFSAIFHSISAFCNAGFTLFDKSLTAYSAEPIVNSTIMILIVVGGLGFWVVNDLYNHLRSRFTKGPLIPLSLQSRVVLVFSSVFIVSGAVLFLLLEGRSVSGSGSGSKFMVALFQSVTTRTAGFNTVDVGALSIPTIMWMMVWMFVGASPGSTGGGTKTTTFAVMLATLRSVLTGKERVEIHRRTVADTVVRRAYAVFFISIAWVAFAAFLMTIVGTHGEVDGALPIIFETVSAFGTVGLSMGVTSSLTAYGKVILVITMFAGRIGPLSLILALARRATSPEVAYPEQPIAIG